MNELIYRLTTNPGLEDIVAQELTEKLGPETSAVSCEIKPFGLAGVVLLRPAADSHGERASRDTVESVLMSLRSVFHVIRHLQTVRLSETDDLSELLTVVENTDFPGTSEADTFRVSSNRSGEHNFGSMDIERDAGAVVNRKTGMQVDLEQFSVHVRVDLYHDVCSVGYQLTRRGLDKRFAWQYRPRVALRTVVAYAMLRLAHLQVPPRCVFDPFCGSGTVLLEAASLFPVARIVGSDKVRECVEGARANAVACGYGERIEVYEADARDILEQWEPGSVDAVICNPPFGVRLGRKTDFMHLYTRFLRGTAHALSVGGRAVFLGGKRRHHVAHILHRIPELRLVHVRVIETGGVYPAVYVVERVNSKRAPDSGA